MRFSPLSILSLLGTAHASLGRLTLRHQDEKVEAYSIIPGFKGCELPKPIWALSKFRNYIRGRQDQGPCRFTMYRTSTGLLPAYLKKESQPTMNYTSILFTLKAPAELQTYIKHIAIGQDGHGADCSSARLSYVPKKDEGKPRYLSLKPAIYPTLQQWIPEFVNQIKGGDYLLEVPSTCLNVDPRKLTVLTFHTHENVASQQKLLRHTSIILADRDQCQLGDNVTRIKSYKQYQKRVRSFPRTCIYRWLRDYRWAVPATHIATKSGNTTVLAQTALNEPMLVDQRRRIMVVTLSSISGAACAQSSVYARKKGTGHPLEPLGADDWGLDNEENIYGDLDIPDDNIAIYVPWEMSDTSYDFYFVLPEECKLTNPVLTTGYEDDNILLPNFW